MNMILIDVPDAYTEFIFFITLGEVLKTTCQTGLNSQFIFTKEHMSKNQPVRD